MFDWDVALHALFYSALFLGIAAALVHLFLRVVTQLSKPTIHNPDAEGRHPVIEKKTKTGTVIIDPNRLWGVVRVDLDGSVHVIEAPHEFLELWSAVEVARADATSQVPTSWTSNNNYTYAPSREQTLVDNDPGRPSDMPSLDQHDEQHNQKASRFQQPYSLFDVLDKRQAGYLIIGIDPDGELVQMPISQAFHQMVAGMSGFGKSMYLRSLLYQLLLECESSNIIVGLADIENNTFSEFRKKAGVRWYAGTYLEIDQLFTDLIKELDRRKALYEQIVGATPKDVDRYNVFARQSGKPPLPKIVVIVDEFTALVKNQTAVQKRIVHNLYQLAMRSRKYGIFFVFAGHSFKSDVIDSTVVGQFAVTMAFRLRSLAQSMAVLGEPGAEELSEPGMALMRKRDGHIIAVQAPMIDDNDLQFYLDSINDAGEGPEHAPDSVLHIALVAHEYFNDALPVRKIEEFFREENETGVTYTRTDIANALQWMDENGWSERDKYNARKLSDRAKTIVISVIESREKQQ